MSLPHDISQRDLRMRSKEIMDAVERGQDFTVTRDGREIAHLTPVSNRRTFVPSSEFLALGRCLTADDADQFRADIDAMGDQFEVDPYAR